MYTEEERAKWRERVARWRNGEQVYDAGRIVEKSDNTSVQKQEPVQPIKRDFVAEATRKHAAEAVGPDTRSQYQREQSQSAKQYANQQYQKDKDNAKRAEGLEQMMKTVSPSTYVEAVTGQDLSEVGRFVTDAAIFGGSSALKNTITNVAKTSYKNFTIKNALKTAVNESPVITAYNRNAAVKDFGTLWDYQTYLDNVFPNSKVKNILWHGSKVKGLQSFSTDAIGSNMPIKGSVGMYLAPEKTTAANYGSKGDIYPVLLNSENPFVTNQFFGGISKNGVNVAKISPKVRNTILAENDAVIAPARGEIAFFNPDDALILGSNRDVQGFRNFIRSNRTRLRKQLSKDGYVYHNGGITPGEYKYYGRKINYQNPELDRLSDYQLDDMLGDCIGNGAERTVYQDLRNNNRVLKITDGGADDVQITNIKDLPEYVEESLMINQLPGVPPLSYEGFIKDGSRYLPVFSQQKVTPLKKVADPFEAFTKQYILPNGKTPTGKLSAIRRIDTDKTFGRLGYKPIKNKPGRFTVDGFPGIISDLGQKNIGIDALGNIKIFDPMIE